MRGNGRSGPRRRPLSRGARSESRRWLYGTVSSDKAGSCCALAMTIGSGRVYSWTQGKRTAGTSGRLRMTTGHGAPGLLRIGARGSQPRSVRPRRPRIENSNEWSLKPEMPHSHRVSSRCTMTARSGGSHSSSPGRPRVATTSIWRARTAATIPRSRRSPRFPRHRVPARSLHRPSWQEFSFVANAGLASVASAPRKASTEAAGGGSSPRLSLLNERAASRRGTSQPGIVAVPNCA